MLSLATTILNFGIGEIGEISHDCEFICWFALPDTKSVLPLLPPARFPCPGLGACASVWALGGAPPFLLLFVPLFSVLVRAGSRCQPVAINWLKAVFGICSIRLVIPAKAVCTKGNLRDPITNEPNTPNLQKFRRGSGADRSAPGIRLNTFPEATAQQWSRH